MFYKIEILYDNNITKTITVNVNSIQITYNINNNGKSLVLISSSEEKILQQLILINSNPSYIKIYKDDILYREYYNIFNYYYSEEINTSFQELLHFDLK